MEQSSNVLKERSPAIGGFPVVDVVRVRSEIGRDVTVLLSEQNRSPPERVSHAKLIEHVGILSAKIRNDYISLLEVTHDSSEEISDHRCRSGAGIAESSRLNGGFDVLLKEPGPFTFRADFRNRRERHDDEAATRAGQSQ